MLHTLKSPKTKHKSKRLGRGPGSGVGAHTVGRGTKGQKSRTGYKAPRPGFEGGQNPISRRLPALRGAFAKDSRSRRFITAKLKKEVIKLSTLEKLVNEGDVVDTKKLQELKLVYIPAHKNVDIKILFDKEVKKKFIIKGLKLSEKAKESITKTGGSVE